MPDRARRTTGRSSSFVTQPGATPDAMLAALLVAFALMQAPRIDDGVALAVDGDYLQALSRFERLRKSDPTSPVYNYYVGLCHLYLRDTQLARHYLDRSTEQEATFPKNVLLAGAGLAGGRRLQRGRRSR